jgi:hypothetical protein
MNAADLLAKSRSAHLYTRESERCAAHHPASKGTVPDGPAEAREKVCHGICTSHRATEVLCRKFLQSCDNTSELGETD